MGTEDIGGKFEFGDAKTDASGANGHAKAGGDAGTPNDQRWTRCWGIKGWAESTACRIACAADSTKRHEVLDVVV